MKRIISLCFSALFLVACTSEVVNFEDTSEAGRIKLGIDNLNDVPMTYSTATETENRINDCVLLVYRGSSCAAAEQIDVSDIVNNGSALPILPPTTTKLQNGDKLYVICNTGVAAVQCAESTINSTYTTQRTYKGGDLMPFSAVIDNYTTTNFFAVATRAVAKIQVQMGTSVPDNTGTFTLANVTWNAVNYGTTASTILPTTTNTPSTDATTDNFRLLQYEGATEAQTTLYLPEYSSSTGGAANDTDFDADRQCILLKKSANGVDTYYRLDFINRDTKKFIDTKRNCHYIFTINKVMREGYRTAAEALANPASNIEYDIEIDNPYKNTTSNGQYAISFDRAYQYGATMESMLDSARLFNETPLRISFNSSAETEGKLAITTAYLEILDASGNPVAIPDFLTVDNGATISGNTIQFGNQSGTKQYNLRSNITTTVQEAAADAMNNYTFRVHLGNIQKTIPITANRDIVEIPQIYLFWSNDDCNGNNIIDAHGEDYVFDFGKISATRANVSFTMPTGMTFAAGTQSGVSISGQNVTIAKGTKTDLKMYIAPELRTKKSFNIIYSDEYNNYQNQYYTWENRIGYPAQTVSTGLNPITVSNKTIDPRSTTTGWTTSISSNGDITVGENPAVDINILPTTVLKTNEAVYNATTLGCIPTRVYVQQNEFALVTTPMYYDPASGYFTLMPNAQSDPIVTPANQLFAVTASNSDNWSASANKYRYVVNTATNTITKTNNLTWDNAKADAPEGDICNYVTPLYAFRTPTLTESLRLIDANVVSFPGRPYVRFRFNSQNYDVQLYGVYNGITGLLNGGPLGLTLTIGTGWHLMYYSSTSNITGDYVETPLIRSYPSPIYAGIKLWAYPMWTNLRMCVRN